MRSHPSSDRFEFVGRSVSLEIIASPADQREITNDVSLDRIEPVDARRVRFRTGVQELVSVVDLFSATRTIWRSRNQVHKVADRKYGRVDRKILIARPVKDSAAEPSGPNTDRLRQNERFVLRSTNVSVKCRVSRSAQRRDSRLVLQFPPAMIPSGTDPTRRADAAFDISRRFEELGSRRFFITATSATHRAEFIERLNDTHGDILPLDCAEATP